MRAWSSICLAVLLVALALKAGTDDGLSESERKGQVLAAKLRSLAPATNAELRGVLNIRKADEIVQVPIITRIVSGSPIWEGIYETDPPDKKAAEKLVIQHHADQPNDYLFTPDKAAAPPAKVTGPQLATAFGGSDFWILDLGMEFLSWPGQRVIKKDPPLMRLSRPCDLLECTTPNPIPGGYARVLAYVDKETGGLIQAEAFDSAGKLLKEFSVRSVKKIRGQPQLKEIQIRNTKTKSRTRLDFDLEKDDGK